MERSQPGNPAGRSIGHRSAAVAFLAVVSISGCRRPPPGPAAETLEAFWRAVQGRQTDRLQCLMAPAVGSRRLPADPAGFEAWALERFAEYDLGRERGSVAPDQEGLALVQLLSLGQTSSLRQLSAEARGSDALVVHTEVRLGYSHLDLSGRPRGTTFHVSAPPLGRVRAIRVPPSSGEVLAEVLDRVRVDFRLVRVGERPGCPAGWAVASAAAVPGSERAERVRWVF